MPYKKIKSYNYSEEELRDIWHKEYCAPDVTISTFDGILIKCYDDMFDHLFFESKDSKKGDKSILSLNRLEKIYWIKDTLADATALIKQGWDKSKKKYVPNRRISFVKDNYIVIISVNRKRTQARLITAYEMQNNEKIENIRNAPNWA
jgi:hypothetical protein